MIELFNKDGKSIMNLGFTISVAAVSLLLSGCLGVKIVPNETAGPGGNSKTVSANGSSKSGNANESAKKYTDAAFEAYDQGNTKKAFELFSQACERSDGEGCVTLGDMYGAGTVVKKDLKKRDELYKKGTSLASKGCDSGNALDCSMLGSYAFNGEYGVKRDNSKAASLWTKACNAGDSSGCTNVGNMYLTGKGVKKDIKKGIELSVKSCNSGNGQGCHNAGSGYQQLKDRVTAHKFFVLGCNANYNPSCTALEIGN